MSVPALASNIVTIPGTPVNAEDAKRVKLFEPFQQKSVTIHNKIGYPPMCMYSAKDGFLNDFHVMYYGSFAIRGGLIILEAAAVRSGGRISPQDVGLWDDAHIPRLKGVVDAIKSQGVTAGLQIAHVGRKASMSPPFKGDYLETEADGG